MAGPEAGGDAVRGFRGERLVAQQASRAVDPGRVPVQPRHALPAVLRSQADGQDPAVIDSGVGDQGHRGRPGSPVGPQVPHGAALDLRTRPAGRDDLDQPVCAHRAAEDHLAPDQNPDPG